MKTIIAGSRTLGSTDLESAFKAYRPKITQVVCGCANGIDRIGFEYARENDISVIFYPAWAYQYDWAFFNKKPEEKIVYPRGGYACLSKLAGFARNKAMAKYGEFLLAVLDVTNGRGTNGTLNMIREAENHGLGIFTHKVSVAGLRPIGYRLSRRV